MRGLCEEGGLERGVAAVIVEIVEGEALKSGLLDLIGEYDLIEVVVEGVRILQEHHWKLFAFILINMLILVYA